jgi:RHS repeat-associated protein
VSKGSLKNRLLPSLLLMVVWLTNGVTAQNYVAAVSDDGRVYTVKANASGQFSGWTQIGSIGGNARGIAIDYFDNDVYPDIIVGRGDGSNVYLYRILGLANGGFGSPVSIGSFAGSNSWCMDMASGDFNEDGRSDFIVNTNNSPTAIYFQNASGAFAPRVLSWSGYGRGMDAGDINKDGHLDIVRGENSSGYINLYLGDGAGNFTFARTIGDAGDDPYGVAIGDFNEDGNLDAIANYASNGDVTLWLGNGDGTFRSGVRPSGADVDNYGSFGAFDYNQDGHCDLIVSNYSGQQVYFFPGLGTGSFGAAVQLSAGSNGNILSVSSMLRKHPSAPIAIINPAEQTISAGGTAHFDASASQGAISNWQWVFGNGETGTTAVADVTYAVKGEYWALLRVTGTNSLWDMVRGHVMVNNGVPVVNTGGPYMWDEANARNAFWTGTLDASGTINDGGSGAKYDWNFMPDLSFSEDFSTGTIDESKWRFANSAQSAGVLRVGIASQGSWGSAYLESQSNFPRREGMTLYTRYRCLASENLMFGFKSTNTDHNYPQLYYAFYPAGTGLYIYEAGNSRGQVGTLVYGVWYDFKLELIETGANYWFKPADSPTWSLIYQSTYQNNADMKIAICGYYQGQNEFDNLFLGNIDQGKQVTHTFHNMGTYPVSLTVTDFLGQSSTVTTQVTTQGNNPPVAVTGGPYVLDERAASQGTWNVQLDGGSSTDDFGIWDYTWNFGDGTTGTGQRPTHAYATRGPHTITLTVRDHAGQTDSDQGIVSFSANNPPVARITAPAQIDERNASASVWTAAFSGSASTDDIGIWRYEWNFGDGGTSTGRDVSHGFGRTGTFTVTLTVYDHAGQSNSVTHQITVVANQIPVARITAPVRVDENVCRNQKWTVNFDGRASSDDYGVWRYEWNFGDGGTSTAANPTYQYSALGTYTVRLTAFDNANQAHNTTQNITVAANDLPVARISANPLTVEGIQPVNFSAASSSDDFGVNGYAWDFGIKNYGFSGTTINTNEWQTRGNVAQNNAILITGASSWGVTGIFSNDIYVRASVFTATIQTRSGYQHAMIGFKNTSDNIHYGQFPYAIYLSDGSLGVYEDGNGRGNFATYTRGNSYDVRIELRPGVGAIYQYRATGATPWTTLYTSSYASGVAMCVGMDVYANTFEIRSLSVNRRAAEAQTICQFNAATDISLTVTDHAGQQGSATQRINVLTGQPPVAIVTAPITYNANLEVPFSALRSTDDYGILRYEWNFGDGSSVEYGPQAGHVYATSGNYTVTLSVSDYAGQRTNATHAIAIGGGQLVTAVPWQFSGDAEIPHDCWSGKQIRLKAVASTAALPFTYTWDFGDGTPVSTGTVTTRDASYKIEAQHSYTGGIGTPFVATITVVDNAGTQSSDTYPVVVRSKSLDVETNVAIDEALWYLHKNQSRTTNAGLRTGYWSGYGGFVTNISASSIQAFEINGHLATGDPTKDPYVETVQRGLDYIFTILTYQNIGIQTYGNPDANGNGIAVTCTEGNAPYQLGAIMDAVIATHTPNMIARTGGTNIKGRRYFDIVQDMADMYSWGQVDAGWPRGGWRYGWNGDADNSAAQWGAIGLIPAERLWGITVPEFVKTENRVWTDYSYWSGGGFGYTGPSYSYELSPCGMVQLAFNGTTTSGTQWVATEQWMANSWTGFRNANTTYGFYAFAKAMRLAQPSPIVNIRPTGLDWYSDNIVGMRRTLINSQSTDGSWLSSHPYPSERVHNTAWTTIILTPTLFEIPPVAIASASPNPGAIGQAIRLDGSSSYHLDPFRRIVTYEWDFNANDGVDWAHPDATGPIATRAYGALGVYTATLRVGDDFTPPRYVTTTVVVNITIPPHAPTSVPGGPYIASVGEPATLDGSGSFDVDKPQGDSIIAYGWEIDMQNPRDFDDALGAKPANVVYSTAGIFNIGLRVTDNTAHVFPQSGQPNLTNDAYTTVTVYNNCVNNFAARAKEIKVTLTWTNNGAAPYTVLRSTHSANYGYQVIGTTSNTYSTFTDYNVEKNVRYYYRIQDANNCLSYASSVVPTTRVVNRRPVITSAPVDTAREAQLYRYNVIASDPDGNPITYALDQAPIGMTISSTGVIEWTPAYADRGDRPLSIRVSDATTSAVQYFILHVIPRTNLPPVVAISGPAQALSSTPVFFDGSGTADPEGDDPISYSWTFGDGQTAANANATHTFAASGAYVITLFATDSRGATGTGTHTIIINDPNRPPVANPGGPYLVAALDSVIFDGSASSDPDGDPLTFTWNFGDDKIAQHGAIVKHLFDAAGTYHASLEVTDNRGGSHAEVFDVPVTSPNNPPIVRLLVNADFGNVGDEFMLDATTSTDQDGDQLVYTWNFGDNSNMNGDVVTHRFQEPGAYTVVLTADDQRGKTARKDTTIRINAPPVFTSAPPESTYEDLACIYDAHADDPDADAITYSLPTSLTGLSVDHGTGRVFWTPGNDAVGSHSIELRASDNKGRTVAQVFSIRVINVNDAPYITSTAVVAAQETKPYGYDVDAEDVDIGDVVTFSLTTAPEGMVIDAVSGLIAWTPTHAHLGPQAVAVHVADRNGGFATQSFEVVVAELSRPPVFTSTPVVTATEDAPYAYQATAEDPNAADVLSFSIVHAPIGMTIDATSGLVSWTPLNSQVGTNNVNLRVTDPTGLTQDQIFAVTVANVNDAPEITSIAPLQAQVDVLYTYTVTAHDIDAGDVLTFSLASGSGNAVINPQSGVVTWTPAVVEEGQRSLTVRVTDAAGASADQTFTVNVQLEPRPPVFTSAPIVDATEEALYTYQATAEDPNADALTFELVAGPAGMTVSAAGLVQFTPTNAQVGPHAVSIRVTDGRFPVVQEYTLLVANVNDDPVITSTPVLLTPRGLAYRYQVVATDEDNDALTYSLTQAPVGMTVSTGGVITWPDDGHRSNNQSVALVVSDGHDGTATQTWSITITDVQIAPPVVQITVTPSQAIVGHPVDIHVTATSSTTIASLTAFLNGNPIILDAGGHYRYTATAVGFQLASAQAADVYGQPDADTVHFSIGDPNNATFPDVSLVDEDCITVTDIYTMNGTASDPDGVHYKFQVRERGATNWTTCFEGWGTSVNGALGVFDPTMLRNGAYESRLYAEDPNGNLSTWPGCLVIDGGMKVGQVNFAVTDLTVQAPGMPISLVREYDSRVTNGDFGPGWSLPQSNVRAGATDTLGKDWLQQSGGGLFRTYWLIPQKRKEVVIRFSDTDVDRFVMKISPATSLLVPYGHLTPEVYFQPIDGTQGGLVALDENSVCLYISDQLLNFDFEVYNPQWFKVTRRDGSVYVIGPRGLESMTDVNGNTTTYANDGIHSSSGVSMSFERGSGNRIEAVTDQLGRRIEYEYDAEGNLSKVTQKGQSALERIVGQYAYAYGIPELQHKMKAISAPDGKSLCQFEYDSDGRLTGVFDAEGNKILYSSDLINHQQTITDRLGNTTVYHYDEKGNVTEKADALGRTTQWEYDAGGHMTREILPDGSSNAKTYSPSGDVLSETDALGHTTSYTYDARGNVLTTRDPLGNVTANAYDAKGNLTQTLDALNHVTASFVYDAAGNMNTMTDASGVARSFAYDASGNQTGTSYQWVNPADPNDKRTVTTQTHYDNQGRVTRTIDPQNHATVNQYDDLGNMVLTIGKLNDTTRYVYDQNKRVIETRYPDRTLARSVYDANGKVIYATERYLAGQSAFGTHTVYDAEGRTTRTERLSGLEISIDLSGAYPASSLGSSGTVLAATSTEYNALGWVLSATNEEGQVTHYEYDDVGRRTAIIDPLGKRTEFVYDAAGRQTLMRDALGREIEYVYDASGRLIRTIYPDGTETRTTYDVLGRRIAETDQAGKIRRFEYDNVGRLSAAILPQVADPENGNHFVNPRYEYEYNPSGTLNLIRDAKGRETNFTYDELNRQLTRALPLGQTERTAYDAFGRVNRKTDFKGQVAEFVYDSFGRVAKKRMYAAGSVTPIDSVTFTYDNLGRRSQIVESRGTTVFGYDAMGNLVRVTSPEGIINYSYDVVTGRKTRTYTDNSDIRYGYDQLGRLMTVSLFKRNGEVLASPEVTTYSYTDVGSRASTQMPNGITTSYQYNNLNRLTNLVHTNALSQVVGGFAYTLAPDGRRTGVDEALQQANGTNELNAITYTYDDLNRLTRETAVAQGDNAGYDGQYVYDLVGNRLERSIGIGAEALVTTYTYDDNDRLISEINSIATGYLQENGVWKYAYGGMSGNGPTKISLNSIGALMRGLPSSWAGNVLIALMVMMLVAFNGPLVTRLRHRTFPTDDGRVRGLVFNPYSLFNRCVSMAMAWAMIVLLFPTDTLAQQASSYSQLATTDWGRQGQTVDYTYDDNGSVVRKEVSGPDAETIDYTYNLENRLTGMVSTRTDDQSRQVEVTTSYAYNQDGIRVGSQMTTITDGAVTAQETKLFLLDSYNHTGYAQVLEELPAVGATPITSYVIGDDVLSQSSIRNSEFETRHFLYDGHGSTRQLSSGAGQITDVFSYDAYGVMLGGNPTRANPAATSMLYSGEQFDVDLQQQYLRARYYDQNNGRFTQLDPFAGNSYDPQSLHKYAYCHEDPVNGVDPSGEFSLGEMMTVVTILNLIVGIGISLWSFNSIAASGFKISGYIVSGRFDLSYNGFGGGIGADVLVDANSGEVFASIAGEAVIDPLSLFKNFKGGGGTVVVGLVFGMTDPQQLSGWGFSAFWPTSVMHLLPLIGGRSNVWGAMCQFAKNVKHHTGAVVGFGQSSSGPGTLFFGTSYRMFSTAVDYNSSFVPIAQIAQWASDIVDELSAIGNSLRALGTDFDGFAQNADQALSLLP